MLGWVLTAVLCAVAVVSLAPGWVGLSTTTPVAQAIALRPLLVVGFGLLGALLLLAVLVAALRRRWWPRRTVLAVVLLVVAAGHAWVLYYRGIEDAPLPETVATALVAAGVRLRGFGVEQETLEDRFVALNHTFLLLTLLCVTTAVGAGVLRTERDPAPRGERAGVGH